MKKFFKIKFKKKLFQEYSKKILRIFSNSVTKAIKNQVGVVRVIPFASTHKSSILQSLATTLKKR